MIPLLPYKRLVFQSSLSREEIIRRLTIEVASCGSGGWLFERRTQDFEGLVSDEGFKISRVIRYRNSFLPIVEGKFSPIVNGVRIDVTMRLHFAVLLFSIVWLSGVGFGVLTVVKHLISTGRFDSVIFIPFGMLLFGYLLITLGFGIEANKSSDLLNDIFESDG